MVIGNAAQALHPIAGQGFNLGVRDAYELGQAIIRTPRDALGDGPMLAAFAARRRPDRYAGIAFTHGLAQIFATDSPLVRWPRGLALTHSASETSLHPRDAFRLLLNARSLLSCNIPP